MSDTIKIARCEHPLFDSGECFTVDTETRIISHPNPKSLVLVQGDANSEVYTVRIPKLIDNHPIDACNKVTIHYINTGENREVCEDIYEISELKAYPDDDENLYAEWILSGNTSLYNGNLSFAIKFMGIADDEIGTILYSWSTLPYTGISVGRTITNTESVYIQYSDVLAKWYDQLVGAEANLGNKISSQIAIAQEAVVNKGNDIAASLSAKYSNYTNSNYMYYLNLFVRIDSYGPGTYMVIKDIPISGNDINSEKYVYMTCESNKDVLDVYIGDNKSSAMSSNTVCGYAPITIYGEMSSFIRTVVEFSVKLIENLDNPTLGIRLSSVTTYPTDSEGERTYTNDGIDIRQENSSDWHSHIEYMENEFNFESLADSKNMIYIEKVKSVQPMINNAINQAKQYTDAMTAQLQGTYIILRDYEYGDPYRLYIMNGQLHVEPYTEPYKEE